MAVDFAGGGVPNGYALDWVKELLHYYTEYGILEVLNVNYGTVLLGLMLYKLGVNTKFKISVFLGIDNPYSALNIFMLSKMFSRSDGSCGLAGLNLSNSVNSDTIEKIADFRQSFGFEDSIRIEHHITEAYKGIVRQPYDRVDELLHLAGKVKNISAKHEGGVPQDEESLYHPSNITDYFLLKPEINKLMPQLEQNYLLKHGAVNRSAKALALQNLAFLGAPKLHF